jgi:hypothetical protein
LFGEREWMGEDLVPDRPVLHTGTDRGDDSRRLDAERHRRCPSHIPIAHADEVVPVADTGALDLDQHLAVTERSRFRNLEQLKIAAELLDSGYTHGSRGVETP